MQSRLLHASISTETAKYRHIPTPDRDVLYIAVESMPVHKFSIAKIIMSGDTLLACECTITKYMYDLLIDKIHPELCMADATISSYTTTDLDPIIPDVSPYRIRYTSHLKYRKIFHRDVQYIYKICDLHKMDMPYIYVCSIYLHHVDWFVVTVNGPLIVDAYGCRRGEYCMSQARPNLLMPEVMHPAYLAVGPSQPAYMMPWGIFDIMSDAVKVFDSGNIEKTYGFNYVENDERRIMWQLIHTWYQRGLHRDVIGEILQFAGMRKIDISHS